MSVSPISNSNSWMPQTSNVSQTQRQGPDGDGDGGKVHGHRHGQGGGFMNAITNALSQLGASTSATAAASNASGSDSSSNASTATQEQAQALSSFMQTLMGALHAQSAQAGGSTQAGGDGDGDNDGGASAIQGHRHHRGNMQADLQSLMQQLASSSDSGSSASASGGTDSNVSALQQSFQNLMSAYGDTNSNATLSNFLQNLSSQFSGAATSGNVVRTTA